MDVNPEVKEESISLEAQPTATNGDVKSGKTEEKIGGFVVLDDIPSSKDVEASDKTQDKLDGKDEKVTSPITQTELSTKESGKEPIADIEKNGDSLILTADEDLEAVSSPKKPQSETISAEGEKSVEETSDSKIPNSGSEEASIVVSKASEKPNNKNQRIIWVSNISKTIKATDLKQHLSKAGKVITAKIVTDGKRCFGYVLMENASDALECIKTLNNTSFDGKNLTLSFDKPIKTNDSSKSSESRSNSTKATKEGSRRDSEVKRSEKRRRSSSKISNDKSKQNSEIKGTEDSKRSEKKVRTHSRSRSRDRYVRERNERDRLRRRIMDEERRSHEARLRQIEKEQKQREKEFKLDQERRKLQLEREIFEKQKREWGRINEERHKLEMARLEVEKQRVKLEDDIKKERMKRKSPEMMSSVVSKILDPSKKGLKRDSFKSPYDISAPPPPKLGMDFDLSTRKMDDRKLGRIGVRKMEDDRKFYGDLVDRKKHFGRKPDFDDNKPYMKRYPDDREEVHRTQSQWSPPSGGYGSGVGTSTPRYQENLPSQSFGGGQSSRGSGYYYHPTTSTQEFPRYDQVSNRKY